MSTHVITPTFHSMKNSPLIKYTLMFLGIAAASVLMWPGLLRHLFSADYMPHAMCLLNEPRLLWLHITSDTVIGVSYVAISLTLAWLVHRARRDIPFSWIFLAFGLFIIACGATHFMEVVTLWQPVYWLSGDMKLITAIASVVTAIILPPLIPKTLDLIKTAKISEEQRARIEAQNRELETMTRKLRELDELKTQFFANISHELRTPLSLVLGRTEKLIRSCTLGSAERRDLEVVHRNSCALLKQVNDLLDVSKLEAGRMTLDYAVVDLARFVRRTAAIFEPASRDHPFTYICEAPQQLDAQVDPDKLERILLNLLSNAFKFTPNGGTIRCELARDGDHAVLAISDSGPGIPVEAREAVFERFRQLDATATRRFDGSGLGLAIVKNFVDLHHGEVQVGEAKEGGAKFTVKLPLLAPDADRVSASTEDVEGWQQRALHVVDGLAPAVVDLPTQMVDVENALAAAPVLLVVEDNPEMNRFIVESLAGEYRVVSALSGKEALDKALVELPDVILTDVMMPGFSGEDLLRELRARAQFDTTPVVLITAKADADARVLALRAGAQDYIMKPFSVEELRVRIGNLVILGRTRKLLQRELKTDTNDVEQLAHEVSVRRRQLTAALEALRASETRFRTLVESNILGVITAGFDGNITEANDAFLKMLGYTVGDLKDGKLNWRAMTPPEYTEADLEALQQMNATGTSIPRQKEYFATDGTRVPVLVGAAKMEGTPERSVAFVLDLTEQRKAEARIAVQFDVARLLALSTNIEEAAPRILHAIGERLRWDYGEIWTRDSGAKALRCIETWTSESVCSPEFERLTRRAGFKCDEGLPGRVWSTATPCWLSDLGKELCFARAPLAVREGLRSACGFPIILKNDILGVFAFFSRKCQEPDQELLDLLAGIGNQIGQFVEGNRGEAALRESEQRFRSAVEAMPQIVWTAEPEGSVDYYNQRWYDYTGMTYEQTQARGWQPVVHPDDLQLSFNRWTHSLSTGDTYEIECRIRRHDGVYRWHLGRAGPLRDSSGRITKWFGTLTDIDDQKHADITEQRMAAIVESSDDAIVGKTLDGIVTSWNLGAEHIYGYKAEEMIGKPIWLLSPPDRTSEMTEILARLKRGERTEHMETVRKTKDGRLIDVSLSISVVRNAAGEIIGASTIARDITELRRAEQALRNSEKHAMVGRLSAIMAHEINNPLEAVSNVLYLLSTRPLLDDEGRQYVNIAAQEMNRIAHIVKQTLGFYRESALPVMVNVPELVEDVITLYARKLSEKEILLERDYGIVDDILAFPAEMRQVVSNLLINAIEALDRGGKLRIRVRATRDWSNPNRCGVRVVLGDSGSGISPEHRRDLFEPFFTTKGEKGTGLGLWVSNGIVQKHGGKIRVRSSVKAGRTGTCFSVFLPSEGMPRGITSAGLSDIVIPQTEIAG